jgi:hypothetical protein
MGRSAAVKKSGERIDTKLEKAGPLYSAWARPRWVIQCRHDLHDRDRSGSHTSTTY